MDIHKVIVEFGNCGIVSPGPTIRYTYSWTRKIIQEMNCRCYFDAPSMRHGICYRDHPSGKHECDRKMLAELNTLVPKRRREKVDRQLVRSIIGLKHKLVLGIWSNQLGSELHKPVRRRFEKRTVFAKQIDDI